MKFLQLLVMFVLTVNWANGQVSKTVDVATAGTLSTLLTPGELTTVTHLILTGSINAADFNTMRLNMTVLDTIDLSGVTTEGDSIPHEGLSGKLSLRAITLPASVKIIGVGAFVSCFNLQKIDIPAGVDSISEAAFMMCNALHSVTFPSSLAGIGPGAFILCPSLTDIDLPLYLLRIGRSAFYGCGMSTVHIPDNVQYIGNYAFTSPRLAEITVDAAAANYSSADGVLFNKDMTILHAYPEAKVLKDYTIPSGVILVSDGAFVTCPNLNNIIIPQSVTSLGKNPFSLSDSLTSIIVDDLNPAYSSHDGVLYNKDKTLLINFPGNKRTSVDIQGTVTTIGPYAFSNSKSLTDLVLPSKLVSIKESAFYNCVNLESLDLPESLEFIGTSAFQNCKKIDSLKIPVAVDSINEAVFTACNDLKSLTFSSSVTYVTSSSVMQCSNLDFIKINADVPPSMPPGPRFFQALDTVNCYLYVPSASLSLYENTAPWKTFNHIIGFDAYLNASTNTIPVEASGSNSKNFEIESNTDWAISVDQAWLHLNRITGMDNANIVFTADANPINLSRQANITIEGAEAEDVTIAVVQSGVPTGVDNMDLPAISVNLNASHELLSVRGAAGNALAIYNMQGNLVISGKVASESEIIDVHQLPSGIYLVKTGDYSIKISK